MGESPGKLECAKRSFRMSHLYEYIPTQQPLAGAEKYVGEIARGYDAKREDLPKWTIEQTIIEDMLDGITDGSWILDVPCGTGRFFKYYQEHRHQVWAMDMRQDMINEGRPKITEKNLHLFRPIIFEIGKLDEEGKKIPLPFDKKSVDASVMCRLTRWLSPEDCQFAWRELQRVTRQKIIFTARVRNHEHARTYELINSSLDGWKIVRDEPGVDVDYRVIELRPTT